jgi:DNA polymerase-3 subunit gamma/tau
MANPGARDHFARGGSEDVLREAIVVVLGADFKIETMVDVSASPSSAPIRTPNPSALDQSTPPVSTPAVGAPAAAEASAPVDPALREKARQGIRPTRRAAEGPADDDRDAAVSRDDSDLDETAESHTELLARHLGAEIIAEEEDGA